MSEKDGKPDWPRILKGATPEKVARALLQPREAVKPPAK